MSAARLFATLILLVPSATWAAAPEPPPGAATCADCHATSRSVATPVPKIYGRPAGDIVALIAKFRSGTRPATIMDRIAKGFSEDEIRAIADWLATQRQK